MPVAKTVFWLSFGGVFYVFFGYPLLLAAWRTIARRKTIEKSYGEPSVSIIIAAWNERAHLAAKLDNCLGLDYPADRREIIVALDGSTDGSDDIARSYTDRGVTVLESSTRDGKAVRLNEAVAVAGGEILVFADARQRLDAGAVRELVAVLNDPTVGVVSGELVLQRSGEDGGEDSSGPGLYWRYEKWIRSMESDVHSILGATGALYAIRRELFEPLEPGTILDDVTIPMRAILKGNRAVFEPRAKVYDAACGEEREFERKVRTLTGNYQLLAFMPALLNPARNPVFLQLVSHKVGRLVAPYGLMALLASNLFLREGPYLVMLIAQLAFYGAALVGAMVSRRTVSVAHAELRT